MLEKIEPFLLAIQQTEIPNDLCIVLEKHLEQLGFRWFTYLLTWPPDTPQSPFTLTNYPHHWSVHYDDQNYTHQDSVLRYAAHHVVPFNWNDLTDQAQLNSTQRLIFNEASEAGLASGCTVPIHGPGPVKAALSVANDATPREFTHLFELHRHTLHIMAAYLHERIVGLRLYRQTQTPIATPHLSQREVQALVWTAKGKRQEEVGSILNIQTDTVKVHLEKARRKLDASSTAHAIVIAMAAGLLLP